MPKLKKKSQSQRLNDMKAFRQSHQSETACSSNLPGTSETCNDELDDKVNIEVTSTVSMSEG